MPDPIDVHVGARMRTIRENRGVSQKEAAKLLGISFQQIQKYETGTNRLSASRMWHLGKILDFAPADLFEGISNNSMAAATDSRGDRLRLELLRSFNQIDDLAARRALLATARAFANYQRNAA